MTSLEIRRLGCTEMCPASVGLGAAWWGRSSEADTIAAIHRSIELGVNYFDTYPGDTEDRWGKALAGTRRQDVYLQAKVSRVTQRRCDFSAQSTRESVEESLRQLRTEYLDAVLIHGCDQLADFEALDTEDPLAPENALDELLRMKEEGKVLHIGIGARSDEVLCRAMNTGHIELVLTYLEYNLLNQAATERLFPRCREGDVGVQLASPLGMGLLTGRLPISGEEERKIPGREPKVDRMLEWCAQRAVDIRHLAMQFCLAAPVESIVLAGPSSIYEVDSAIKALAVEIAPAIWDEFADDFGVRVGLPV